jgi:hypothetical protein
VTVRTVTAVAIGLSCVYGPPPLFVQTNIFELFVNKNSLSAFEGSPIARWDKPGKGDAAAGGGSMGGLKNITPLIEPEFCMKIISNPG